MCLPNCLLLSILEALGGAAGVLAERQACWRRGGCVGGEARVLAERQARWRRGWRASRVLDLNYLTELHNLVELAKPKILVSFGLVSMKILMWGSAIE